MSHAPISHSPDLQRLAEDGYEVEVTGGHIVVHRVPYVTETRCIRLGQLIAPLEVNGDVLSRPQDHTIYFAGEYPCKSDGTPIEAIRNQSQKIELAPGLWADHRFSAKPKPDGSYRDFHHKVSNYAGIISRYARRLDPTVTAQAGKLIVPDDPNDPFNYIESASSRAGITSLSAKLAEDHVGIVGLGGTGSYILDYVSKTRVREIHLFDADEFQQHNAFRSPGATCKDDISKKQNKAEYYAQKYGQMRSGIVSHPITIDHGSFDILSDLDFVFVAIDDNSIKKNLFGWLHEHRVPFIDVGIGLERTEDNSLVGIVRTTVGSPELGLYAPLMKKAERSVKVNDLREYERNIQVVEINALNAALAVIRWKKLRGFYMDLECEIQSTYTLDGNCLYNRKQ